MRYRFYSLSDPDTLEVRYIGVTTNTLAVRFSQHKNAAKSNKDYTYKTKWFKSILNKNKLPLITLLKSYDCDDNSWEQIEIELISKYPNLTNQHSGGKGIVKGERINTTAFNSRSVVKIHPWKDLILETYYNSRIAENLFSGHKTGIISQTCKGKHLHAFGFRWSYLEPLIFSKKLPYLFLYSNNEFIKDYSSQKEFRNDLCNLLRTYEEFTISKNPPTLSTKDS